MKISIASLFNFNNNNNKINLSMHKIKDNQINK